MNEVYDKIIARYKNDCPAVIDWDDVANFFGIEIPDKSIDGMRAWNGYLMERNGFKGKFNSYCKRSKLPYLLFIQEPGHTLMLRKSDNAIQHEEIRLTESVGKRLKYAKDTVGILKDIKELRPSTRKSLTGISDSIQGLLLNLLGAAERMSLPAPEKKSLIDTLTKITMPDEVSDEEEEI